MALLLACKIMILLVFLNVQRHTVFCCLRSEIKSNIFVYYIPYYCLQLKRHSILPQITAVPKCQVTVDIL